MGGWFGMAICPWEFRRDTLSRGEWRFFLSLVDEEAMVKRGKKVNFLLVFFVFHSRSLQQLMVLLRSIWTESIRKNDMAAQPTTPPLLRSLVTLIDSLSFVLYSIARAKRTASVNNYSTGTFEFLLSPPSNYVSHITHARVQVRRQGSSSRRNRYTIKQIISLAGRQLCQSRAIIFQDDALFVDLYLQNLF